MDVLKECKAPEQNHSVTCKYKSSTRPAQPGARKSFKNEPRQTTGADAHVHADSGGAKPLLIISSPPTLQTCWGRLWTEMGVLTTSPMSSMGAQPTCLKKAAAAALCSYMRHMNSWLQDAGLTAPNRPTPAKVPELLARMEKSSAKSSRFGTTITHETHETKTRQSCMLNRASRSVPVPPTVGAGCVVMRHPTHGARESQLVIFFSSF